MSEIEKAIEICELINKALEEMGLTVNGKFTDQTRKLLEEQKIVVSMFAGPEYFGRLLTATRLKPRGASVDNQITANLAKKIDIDRQIVDKYDFDVICLFSRIKTLTHPIYPNSNLIDNIRIWLAPLFVITEELDDIENIYKSVHNELLKYGLDVHEFCNVSSKFSCILKNYAFMSYRRKRKSGNFFLKAFAKHFYRLELEDEDYTEEEIELAYKYSRFHSAVASIARLRNLGISQVQLEIPTRAYIDTNDKTIGISME